MLRKTINILLWLMLLAYLITAFIFVDIKQERIYFRNVKISVEDSLNNNFINKRDIVELVKNQYPDIEGKSIKNIDKEELEKTISNSPFIKNAETYSTLTGNLCVKIEQRNPIVRVIPNESKGYYIDEEGGIMGLSKKHTSRVLVATGFIDKETAQGEIFELAQFIYFDQFWRAQINQIYVTKEKEYILVPRVGAQKIELGTIENYRYKFRKLYALYSDGFSKTGWNKYDKINLRYKNQVVCTKK